MFWYNDLVERKVKRSWRSFSLSLDLLILSDSDYISASLTKLRCAQIMGSVLIKTMIFVIFIFKNNKSFSIVSVGWSKLTRIEMNLIIQWVGSRPLLAPMLRLGIVRKPTHTCSKPSHQDSISINTRLVVCYVECFESVEQIRSKP